MSTITNSLNDIFNEHRLIFWYDPEGEMRPEYSAYEADGVKKLEVQNNEFGLKHRMMRTEFNQRFLVYLPYPRPAHKENWFLDLELGHHVFHADGISLILQEMGWQEEHRTFVEKHREFFNSKDRKERLRERSQKNDSERDWPLKMLSVICREEPTLESCMLSLLADLVDGKEEKIQAITKYGLDTFLWDAVARQYDYRTEAPTLLDFVVEVFVTAAPCGRQPKLGREAKVFLGRWKDSNRYREIYVALSQRLETDLDVGVQLNGMEGYTSLLDTDAFEVIERKIIVEIRDAALSEKMGADALRAVIERRESSYWYSKYEHVYAALLASRELVEAIRVLDISFENAKGAIERYAQTYWQIDQLYRHFYFHARRSRQATLLDAVSAEVERRYTNDFLLRLGDRFQQVLELNNYWPPREVSFQRTFFKDHVEPVISKGKLFVIISDALRYEIGEELHQRIHREDRFRSKLSYQVGVVPSYTQLGMAALLPHSSLEVDVKTGEARADGQRTAGLEARKAILAKGGRRATAVKGQAFLNMNAKEEGRALVRDHDVIYIYQNGIDHVGDKRETEVEVFEAADREIEILIALLKKVSAVNGTNILITADHGFLFQQVALDESDFTEKPQGDDAGVLNRRFALGSHFGGTSGSMVMSAKQVGLGGDYFVAIPKSINRYRVKGAGSRFVHGGASLQEVIVPILTINKARKSDTELVEVDVIRSGSNLITTSQARVSFYQEEPAKEKQLGRVLKVGFYAKTGELLSDLKEAIFDSSDQDPRLRERKLTFLFSKVADKPEHRNSEVTLRLEEKITGTNQYRTYKELTYRLKKAFETDFEL